MPRTLVGIISRTGPILYWHHLVLWYSYQDDVEKACILDIYLYCRTRQVQGLSWSTVLLKLSSRIWHPRTLWLIVLFQEDVRSCHSGFASNCHALKFPLFRFQWGTKWGHMQLSETEIQYLNLSFALAGYHTSARLLRKYWADRRDVLCEEGTLQFRIPRWSV